MMLQKKLILQKKIFQKNCKNDVTKDSPEKTGDYQKGWRIKKVQKRQYCPQ